MNDGAKLFVDTCWKEAISNDHRKNKNACNNLHTYHSFKSTKFTYGIAQYVNTCKLYGKMQ